MDKLVILYDGFCVLCVWYIRILIKHDRKDIFRFTALSSPTGQTLAEKFPLPDSETSKSINKISLDGPNSSIVDTVILIKDGVQYTKSDAILVAFGELGGLWRIAKILLFIPKSVRDTVYDLNARVRYKIFGRYEACEIPEKEIRHKFL